MGEGQSGSAKPYDPFEAFRSMRDAYLDAMAKTMVETVNTESYAQASGALLDTTLTLSAPFKDALEKTMVQVLEQLSLPSRQDVLALSERFTNLEMRLDDIEAKLDGLLKQVARPAAPVAAQPEPQPEEPVSSRPVAAPIESAAAETQVATQAAEPAPAPAETPRASPTGGRKPPARKKTTRKEAK